MPISNEVRRLGSRWQMDTGWPKRLEWLDISGIRGWTGQRFSLPFPIMAVVGENGVGKSTILQSAASVYRDPSRRKDRFASDFFPDTTWDQVTNAVISYSVREGDKSIQSTIRKPTGRWRGNPERPQRRVEYIDLSRVQPVPARLGYTKLANPTHKELSGETIDFEKARLRRLSGIMGRSYDLARLAATDADSHRLVPVIGHHGESYSGFHQGAGETTIAELLQADLPEHGLILIDEVESSLHPRAQRRLVRDLAERCRELQLQVVLTTHSPYILEELPLEARACIMQTPNGRREIVYGVSPEFAMTKMDDVQHAECDLYVEDPAAEVMLVEILSHANPNLVQRSQVIPYGAASVGQALGQMAAGGRFPRPSCVFLDGDQGPAIGCLTLPGEDAPERVVFEALKAEGWSSVHTRVGRSYAQVADACSQAMVQQDHHQWVPYAATQLTLGGNNLWQAMCAAWATTCLDDDDAKAVAQAVEDALIGVSPAPHRVAVQSAEEDPAPAPEAQPAPSPTPTPDPNATEPLF